MAGYQVNTMKIITNIEFDISSISLLQKRVNTIVGEKRMRFFNDTDRKSLEDIYHLVSLLSLYQNKNKDERKKILSNALLEIDEVLKWNSGATATKIGRFLLYPLLSSWKKTLSSLNTQDMYNDSCLLTLEMDSPYYSSSLYFLLPYSPYSSFDYSPYFPSSYCSSFPYSSHLDP